MLRWALVLVGCVLVYMGTARWRAFKPLDENAAPVAMKDALLLLNNTSVQSHVRLNASIDASCRIYKTGIPAPRFAAHPPDVVQPLSPQDALRPAVVSKLLGCTVEMKGSLITQCITFDQTGEDPETEKQRVIGQRALAVVRGTKGQILVVSPILPADEPGATQQWLPTDHFTGRLTRLVDLPQNIDGIRLKVPEMVQQLSRQGINVPKQAAVVLTDIGMKQGSQPASQANFILVAGSGHRLFVEATRTQERELREEIQGLVYPAPGQRYGDFTRVLDRPLPARIGIIRPVTAAGYNQAALIEVATWAGPGVLCWVWGLGLIYRQRRKQHLAALEWARQQEMIRQARRRPVRHATAHPGPDLLKYLGR